MPKVLHGVAGCSLLGHVLALTERVGAARLAVVVGPDMADVRAEALEKAPAAEVFVQDAQRGTADAVLAARDLIAAHDGDVLVLYADTPLIKPETVHAMRARLSAGNFAVVLGFRVPEPGSYGRLLTDGAEGPFGDPGGSRCEPRGGRRHALQFRRHGLSQRWPLGCS